MMGAMNGVELALVFAVIWPACRVLLVSGHESAGRILKDDEDKGWAFPIYAKPMHPDTMLEFVARPSTQN